MPLVSPLYSPKTLLEGLTLSEQQSLFIANSQRTAKSILGGKDTRKVLIIGPCSIHNYESAIRYAEKLKSLADIVKETLFIVMRVYVEKPRTTIGWKGFLHDPYLNGTNDVLRGIRLSRRLLIDLAEIGIPTATEFLNPLVTPYLQDLITWGFIGARTSSSQTHRELVSSLSIPVGFKNTLDGSLQCAINGAIASRVSHSFLGIDNEGRGAVIHARGNHDTHIVLRGSDTSTNFDKDSIEHAMRLQKSCGLHSPILIDAAHGNSKKNHLVQEEVFTMIADQFSEESPYLLGIMAESFLKAGNQPFQLADRIDPEISITDPCMDWETTEKLILSCHRRMLMNNFDPHHMLPDVYCPSLSVE